MTMIDIKNLEHLTAQQREQFNNLLNQFPHLDSKMDTSRELNTPSKTDAEPQFITPPTQLTEELDYSNFMAPIPPPVNSRPRDAIPSIKVNAKDSSFKSLEQEEERPRTQDEEANYQKEVKQNRVRAAVASGQPPEIAKFNTEGKTHPILQKMRATVGLRSLQKPTVVNVGGCNYSMRPLDRMAVTNATALAMTTTSNPVLYQSYLESALVAYAIVEIDGVPVVDIFSIPHEDVDKKHINIERQKELAAEAMYAELMASPNELVESLSTHYQQEFPVLNLLGEGKAKFMCPEASCLQTRIVDADAVCYCPIHGDKMAREDMIPNPF